MAADTAKMPTFRTFMTVKLIDHMGSDNQIANVARVSTGTHEDDIEKNKGLLKMLCRDRHGSPFESGIVQFYIESPIFVNREFFRHRIASYNETSARYRELEPVFYVPSRDRYLVQHGRPGAYQFSAGSHEQYEHTIKTMEVAATEAWDKYQYLLRSGIAREVARDVLPMSTFSPFYVTMNVRSLLNFLSLRRKTEDTKVPTFPLREIEMVAEKMEALAADRFPETLRLFNACGRVAP